VLSSNLGWIGVDIGTHTVKLAQAVRSPLGVVLRHAAVIQRSSAWPDEELALAIPVGSSAEIAAALECAGFRGRNAACLLPLNVCELRGLKVPAGSTEERRAMIANELADDWVERALPMEFDFWEVTPDKATETADSFNVNVISVALPWVARVADDCQEARLDCWAVDGGPLAIARAVGLATRMRSDQRVLALDWGFSNATLCVVGNDRPLYARRLHQCSFRRCLEAIQTRLGVTLDRAQHLADTAGLVAASGHDTAWQAVQDAISLAADEVLERLVDEIQRTLRFFESQRRHLRPNAVWLMGGGASLRNLGPHLGHRLAMPVHLWSVPLDPQLGDVADGNHSALFGTAAALSALAWRAA
jgi:type IV pilus assembly protein PilM